MALCQHRAHHAGVATARRTGVYGLGRVSLDMNRLATWLTNPSAAGADTHHQRRAQCSAQAVAQLVHEVVKSAANGDFAVVDWRTKSLGQRHGLLTVAGPDRACEHQVLKHMVVDQTQRIGGVDHQRVVACSRVGTGLEQESVHAGGRVVHQCVAADVHHVFGLRLQRVERVRVAMSLGAIGSDECLLRRAGAQHHAEAGILIKTILADMRNAVVLE